MLSLSFGFSELYTVRELLLYTGRLFSPEATHNELRKRVRNLLNILGLSMQANMRCPDLTGGQRKRVSIGLGLVGEPTVLFLDEPTTGLDSTAALSIVKYISAVAKATNVVCIMTIHQPSTAVFNSLDDLCLLELGRLVYFGLRDNAPAFFSSLGFVCSTGCNPADYYLDVISQQPADAATRHKKTPLVTLTSTTRWETLYRNSRFRVPVETPTTLDSKASSGQNELQRFFVLLGRQLLSNFRAADYYLRAAQLIILGLYLGTLYLRVPHDLDKLTELSGSSFFNIWVVLFSVVAYVPTLCRDRRLVQLEVANGEYKFPTFVSSHLVASIPYNLLIAVIYQAIFFFLVGFNDTFPAWVYAVFCSFSLMLLMEAIALCVSEGLKDPMLSVTFSMVRKEREREKKKKEK